MPITLDPGGSGTSSSDWSYVYDDKTMSDPGGVLKPIKGSSGRTMRLVNESYNTAPVGAFFELYDPFWAQLMSMT